MEAATLTNGDYLSLAEARLLFAGKPPVATVRRWIKKGFFGGAVKLQAHRSGLKLFVTAQWVREFKEALAARYGDQHAEVEAPAAAKKRRKARDDGLRRDGFRV